MQKINLNIKDIISSKNPRLGRVVPGFIYRYLNKILHIKKLDYMINTLNSDGVDFIADCFKIMGTSYSHNNRENVPPNGRYIFTSNHPLGGLDGMVLQKNVSELFGPARFIVNDFLLNVPQLQSVFIGVNKHGRQSSGTYKAIEELYDSDLHVLNFPAGLCSRKINGEIKDLEWRKSFIQKARKYKRDIIPVYIKGRNSNWFYNLSNLRKKIGLKANIEMLYLVDEMFKQENAKIELTYGKPIPHKLFNNPKEDYYWAQKIKSLVYNLNDNPFKGISIND